MTKSNERILAYGFGVLFIVAILLLAILFSKPTPFQYLVFRIVLALSCAGVATMIPGFLEARVGSAIRASGALAVFVIVYFFSPASKIVDNLEETANNSVDGDRPEIEYVQYLQPTEERTYPFELIIKNPTQKNVLISSLKISGHYTSGMFCSSDIEYIAMNVDLTYDISDTNNTLSKILPGFRANGTAIRTSQPKYAYPVVGRMYQYCNNVGLYLDTPINIIVKPESRKIISIMLREGKYGSPKVEYGMRFFQTVGELENQLREQWVKKQKAKNQELKDVSVPVEIKHSLYSKAVALFLVDEELDMQFSNDLSTWGEIESWNFEFKVNDTNRVLRASVSTRKVL